MTPEQLEAIEGIGPKTVEKISLAVNNYFASFETGEAVAVEGEVPADGLAVDELAVEGEGAAEAVRRRAGTSLPIHPPLNGRPRRKPGNTSGPVLAAAICSMTSTARSGVIGPSR